MTEQGLDRHQVQLSKFEEQKTRGGGGELCMAWCNSVTAEH